jgi:ribosomal protein L32
MDSFYEKNANITLANFVAAKPNVIQFKGIDAIVQSFQYGVLKEGSPERNVAAVALVDNNWKVTAAYPKKLVGYVLNGYGGSQDMSDDYLDTRNDNDWLKDDIKKQFKEFLTRDGYSVGRIIINKAQNVFGILVTVINRDLILPTSVTSSLPATPHWFSLVALVAFLLLLPLWVGMDAAWRGMRPYAWGIFVGITSFIGLLAYFIARLPAPAKCPNCGKKVLSRHIRCPHCGVSIRFRCPVCKRPMRPDWQYCPRCNEVFPEADSTSDEKIVDQPVVDSSKKQAVLTVNVVKSESGEPIPGTQIQINGPSRLDGLTNGRGHFECYHLKTGHYTLTAVKTGYEPCSLETDVNESATESIPIELKALPGKIVGRVIDHQTQMPLQQASVSLDSDRINRQTQSNPEGEFSLGELPEGPYMVLAESEQYQSGSKLAEVIPGKVTNLTFSLIPISEQSDLQY